MPRKKKITFAEIEVAEVAIVQRPRRTPDLVKRAAIQKKREDRARANIERGKKIALDYQWKTLVRSLNMERSSVRGSLHYHIPTENMPEDFVNYVTARRTAFNEYDVLLEQLHSVMRALWNEGIYPSMFAKEKNYPNDGSHWSDWISERKKQPVMDLFVAIKPPNNMAKIKEPFVRRISEADWVKQAMALNSALSNAKDQVALELSVYKNGARSLIHVERERRYGKPRPEPAELALKIAKLQEKQRQIVKALAILKDTVVGEPLPRTWHGLLKD